MKKKKTPNKVEKKTPNKRWGREFVRIPVSPDLSEGVREREGEWGTHLLQFEDVLVEIVLQFLVGIVDAELLKAVVLIVLKAKDIQHPNRQNLVREQNRCEHYTGTAVLLT